MGWQPLFPRLQDEHSGDVLHEGIPGWLWPSLEAWLRSQIVNYQDYVSTEVMRDLERQLRVGLGPATWGEALYEVLKSKIVLDTSGELGLEVVNAVLAMGDAVRDDVRRTIECAGVEQVLATSGSAWRVSTEGTTHLEKRVPEEIQSRYQTVSARGRSGEHLRIAWQQMYGQNPNASESYDHGVKAVEVVGAPIIAPNDPKPTLGKMISVFRDMPEKWTVPLGSTQEEGRAALLAMMEGAWHGQHDRHGDEKQPISVDLPEAEAALHVAISLVHLFDSGLVKMISP